MENTQRLENMKSRKEILRKQRQLENQVMEEIEQLWEETQRARNEAASLKRTTKQQQEVINVLMTEKHKRVTLIEELRLQLKNVTDKLREYKACASQEEKQLQKILAAINHERETLGRQYQEIKTEQRRLVRYVQTQSRDFQDLEESLDQNRQIQESTERVAAEGLLNLIEIIKKITLQANQAKEQMEKTLSDIKQELKKNKEILMQQRSVIEQMKHGVNVSVNNVKQRWTQIRDVRRQDILVSQSESRMKEKEGRPIFYPANSKLLTILEEKKKLWEVLESTTDLCGGMEDSGAEADRDLEQDTEDEVGQDSMETNNENEVSTGMKRVILEVEGIRRMLRRVREDSEQSKREMTEEKNQIKWMNFRAKKQRQVLDHQLEKNIRERDDLELMKMRIRRQKEEVEKKLQDSINVFLKMDEIKATMQITAAELHQSREEMLKAQTLMKESSSQAKTLMVGTYLFFCCFCSINNLLKFQKPIKIVSTCPVQY